MDAPDAKEALLAALSGLLESGGDMGEMDTALPLLLEYLRVFARSDVVCAMVPIPPGPVA